MNIKSMLVVSTTQPDSRSGGVNLGPKTYDILCVQPWPLTHTIVDFLL